MTQATELRCTCEQVVLTVEKTPIVNAECCCDSCREAGKRLQGLPGAPSILGPHGTTRFVLYRKDRVRFLEGTRRLKAFRLTSGSTTRRVIAACCSTPVFLEFKGGHWLSLYGGLWPDAALPPLDLRTMTKDLPAGATLPGDVPNARTHTLGFYAKLFGAWVAMGFHDPKIAIADGEIDA